MTHRTVTTGHNHWSRSKVKYIIVQQHVSKHEIGHEGLRARKDHELEEVLEGLIERHGFDQVIPFLGGVCDGKAYQAATVWKDKKEVGWWQEKAQKLWKMCTVPFSNPLKVG